MTDETATPTTVVTTTTVTETFLEKAEDEIQALFETGKTDLEAKIAAFESEVDTVVWPAAKTFLTQFFSQMSQAALGAVVAAGPTLLAGGFGAAGAQIATTLGATAVIDAKTDGQQALQSIQTALQVAKVATSTVTPGDATTVAAISAVTAS